MEPSKQSFKDETSNSIDDSPIIASVPGYDPSIHPLPNEERKALLKVDFYLLPFIVLCFCFLQFDRTNISNALTSTFAADLHVNNSNINLAQTLFTVGFVITELPFNMISRYIGAERFLPVTMILWGVATWSQIFVRNASGLYAIRFFIGALEGGYIPSFALYISKFYTNQELALRYAIFWASNSFAGMLGGPLAIGLLSLSGRGGLHGWQWLFLIGLLILLFIHLTCCMLLVADIWMLEGSLTCFLGVVMYFYLPHNAATPKHIFGKSYNIFTPRESTILITRVIKDDPTKGPRYGKPVLPTHILETFADWRLYGHLVAAFLSMVMISPMNTYAPSIIKSLGFTSLQANGLNSVGSACALVFSVSLAFSSDKLHERGVHIAIGYLWGAAGLLWLALAANGVDKWILYGMFILFIPLSFSSLIQTNFRRRGMDSNGHGIRPGHQRSLAHRKDGRPQTARGPGCVCDEYPACQLSGQSAFSHKRYVQYVHCVHRYI